MCEIKHLNLIEGGFHALLPFTCNLVSGARSAHAQQDPFSAILKGLGLEDEPPPYIEYRERAPAGAACKPRIA